MVAKYYIIFLFGDNCWKLYADFEGEIIMNDNDRKLILELGLNRISEQEFLNTFSIDINSNSVMELLIIAYNEKNADDVDYSLTVAYEFNLITERYVDILCKLLESNWHYKHEDIARALQSLKSPNSIEALYKTSLTKFEYLEYDDSSALARKCTWALGDINTDESKKKLELIASNEMLSEEIRDYAIKQLNRKR